MLKNSLLDEKDTDLGNAKRLIARYQDEIRFVPAWDQWLVWDEHRWSSDAVGGVMVRAKETIRTLFGAADRLPGGDARRSNLLTHARQSERAQRLEAMVRLAKSEPAIVVRPEQLDADPWVLNCLNGTLDLRTGARRPHNRSDLLTKLAPVTYDTQARFAVWENFLCDTTGGDPELLEYLQRVAGYTLAGVTDEEIILLLIGTTKTGKSTFIEALKAAMGDYACTADFETFLRQNQPRGARNDLARLMGARLVTASEAPAGRQFDEAALKQMTGGDRIAARFLYKEAFEFAPQFTIWLAANHRPTVRDDDPAVWRRMKAIPFDHEVPDSKRDPAVKAQLRNPQIGGPAILAWMVEGCLRWQRDGLEEPAAVRNATAAYRSEIEIFSQFIEDSCVLGPDQWAQAQKIQAQFENWSQVQGYRYAYGPKRVASLLRQRGCEPEKRAGSRGWRGVGLVEAA